MATLYVVRHGRTVLNEQDRLRGWMDPSLSEEGTREAGALRDELPPGLRVLSSDLLRAQQTAAILCPRYGVEPALRPWNVGCFAGLQHDRVDRRLRDLTLAEDVRVPFGEPYRAFRERFQALVRSLEGSVVLVTHYRCLVLLSAWGSAGWDDALDGRALLGGAPSTGRVTLFSTPWG